MRDRNLTWSNEVADGAPEGAGREYYLPYFHLYALQGVLDVMEVLARHRDGEISWDSLAAPRKT